MFSIQQKAYCYQAHRRKEQNGYKPNFFGCVTGLLKAFRVVGSDAFEEIVCPGCFVVAVVEVFILNVCAAGVY